jgi:hypothetical protein
MLWVGVLPALSVFYVRKYVKEPPIWLENRQRQRVEQREVRAPLISIFKRQVLANTLTACLWMAGGMVAYYSGQRPVRDASAKGSAPRARARRDADLFRQPGRVPRVVWMGLVVRPLWPALGDDHPRADRSTARTARPAPPEVID